MNKPNPNEVLPDLKNLLEDPDVMEIFLDGYFNLYVEKHGVFVDLPTPFQDNDHLLQALEVLAAFNGRSIHEQSPIQDYRLPITDTIPPSRAHVVLPPIAVNGPVVNIRKMPMELPSIEQLVQWQSLSEDMVEFLQACVDARLNVLVSGGAGSGKTTVLNLLCEMISDDERLIIVQSMSELRLKKQRMVVLESRPPDAQGQGQITMRDLVISALKMRPDRILVGEVHSGEIVDLCQAINTGHDGSMFSLHANNPRDALARLEVMATMADLSIPLLGIREMLGSAIDCIVHMNGVLDGSRKIVKISEVQGLKTDAIVLNDLFEYVQTRYENDRVEGYFTATGNIPRFLEKMRFAGIKLPMSIFEPQS
jgi:pilus assembly protein CpaF